MTNALDTLRLILPTFEDEVQVKNKSAYSPKSILLFTFWVFMVVVPVDSIGIFFMELDIFKTIALFNSIFWFPMVIGLIDIILGQILMATIGIKQIEKEKRAKRKKAKADKTKKDTKKEK
eukprot:CAMPEP_0201596158 /NCGR_PEP_ID=MMETSP0190_2-20130828/192933_1 /ASSEMBLY_ACC=CAM_ASM_000263 /TAXON_ID=37353 /ORGANISM="Rosalina sp." /LENGTH=119 /DNA_ID=CAMNT_0048056407 /DNA_START=625 /DNA_END=984 /DNA_ORIENTATION=+